MPHLTDAKIKTAVDHVIRYWWTSDSIVQEREKQIEFLKRHNRRAASYTFLYSTRLSMVAEMTKVFCHSIAPSSAQILNWAKRWPNRSMLLDSGLRITLTNGPRFEVEGPHQLSSG